MLLRASSAVLGGCLVALAFSAMAVCGRVTAQHQIPPLLTMALRSLFGLFFTLTQALSMNSEKRRAELLLARPQWKLLLLRAPFSWVGQYGSFWAYAQGNLALGDIAALFQTVPIWTIAMGYIFLGTRLRTSQGIAASLAIIGAVFIARPSILFASGGDSTHAIEATQLFTVSVVVAAAIGAGGAYTVVAALNNRGVGATAQVMVNMMVLTTVCFTAAGLLGACTLPSNLPWEAWAALIGVSIFGTAGQIGTVLVVRLASATTFAITQELDVVLNFTWDALLFSRVLDAVSLCGASLICSGILFLAFSDRTAGKHMSSDDAPRDKRELLPADAE